MAGYPEPPPGPLRKSEGVTALAVANFVLGGLQFCGGMCLTLAFTALASLFHFAMQNQADVAEDAEKAKTAFTIVGLIASFGAVVGLVIVFFAALFIAAGFGLLYRRQWGRILTMVLGVLAALVGLAGLTQITHDPGNALYQVAGGVGYCVFAFYVLLDRKTAEEFT